MTVQTLLNCLEIVRGRGASHWSARCPGHADKSPSLSIREGERGILIKCFAGCSIDEICAAIGFRVADLFFDTELSRSQRATPRPQKSDRVALAWRYELAALDRRLRAERIIVASHINIDSLGSDELDRALTHVAQAYTDVQRADLFEGIADDLRGRNFSERRARERHPRAA